MCDGCGYSFHRGIYSSRAQVRAMPSQKEEEEEAPPLFIFLAETSTPVRGGRWGRLVGVGGGRSGRRTFRFSGCRGFQWPAAVEEGAWSGGGPAVAMVRRAGAPVGGGGGGGEKTVAARRRVWLGLAAEAPGRRRSRGRWGMAGERRRRGFCDGSSPNRKLRQIVAPAGAAPPGGDHAGDDLPPLLPLWGHLRAPLCQ